MYAWHNYPDFSHILVDKDCQEFPQKTLFNEGTLLLIEGPEQAVLRAFHYYKDRCDVFVQRNEAVRVEKPFEIFIEETTYLTPGGPANFHLWHWLGKSQNQTPWHFEYNNMPRKGKNIALYVPESQRIPQVVDRVGNLVDCLYDLGRIPAIQMESGKAYMLANNQALEIKPIHRPHDPSPAMRS